MEVFMEMGVRVWRGLYGVCTAHPSTPSYPESLRALSDERFLAAGGQAAFAMSHERFGR